MGPGTCTAKTFARLGFKQCEACRTMEQMMDKAGPQACLDNIEWLTDRICRNIRNRGMPVIPLVTRPLIKHTIRSCCKVADPKVVVRRHRKPRKPCGCGQSQ
jgi:hypothetical protein